MPRFVPFRGLRYDPSLVRLDEVVAPPYDVVDEAGREALASRSEFNSILVELPEDDPGRGLDRYQAAAALLGEWQTKGVLVRDDAPSFYGYRMDFRDEDGRSCRTTGVLGALGLEGADAGEILPHEETMPKPKGDRLFLLRATRTNISPIWGLSLAGGLTGLCSGGEPATGPEPGTVDAPRGGDDSEEILTATDAEGVVHSVWPIRDPQSIDAISRAVGSTPVVIADGHHRFETAVNFRDEVRASAGDQPGDHDAVLAFVVELAEDQLLVRTIHRVISGLPEGFDVIDSLSARFSLEPLASDPEDLSVADLRERQALAIVTRAGGWLLRDQSTASAGKGGDVLGELDSVRLRAGLDALPGHEIDYEPRWATALEAVRQGRADAAFMIRPVTVDQISRAAADRVRMPPKTTYFHPKPRTGMVLRPLDGGAPA